MFVTNLMQHGGTLDTLPAWTRSGPMPVITVKDGDKPSAQLQMGSIELKSDINEEAVRAISRHFLAQQYLHDEADLPEGDRKKALLQVLDKAIKAFLQINNLNLPDIDLKEDDAFFLLSPHGEKVHSFVLFDFILRYAEQSDEDELRRKFYIPDSRIFRKPKSLWTKYPRWVVALYLGVHVLEDESAKKLLEDWGAVEKQYRLFAAATNEFDVSSTVIQTALDVFARLNYLSSSVGSLDDLKRFAPEVSYDEARSQIETVLKYDTRINAVNMSEGFKPLADVFGRERKHLALGKHSRDLVYGSLPSWAGAKVTISRDPDNDNLATVKFELLELNNKRSEYDILIDFHDYIKQDPMGYLCRKDLHRLFVQRFLDLLVNPLRQGSRIFVSASCKTQLASMGRMSHVNWAERELPSYYQSAQIMMTPTYKELTGNVFYKVQFDFIKNQIKVPTADYINTPDSDKFKISPVDLPVEMQIDAESDGLYADRWQQQETKTDKKYAYIIYGGSHADS